MTSDELWHQRFGHSSKVGETALEQAVHGVSKKYLLWLQHQTTKIARRSDGGGDAMPDRRDGRRRQSTTNVSRPLAWRGECRYN